MFGDGMATFAGQLGARIRMDQPRGFEESAMGMTVNTRFERRPTDPIGHLNGYVETDAAPAAPATFKIGYPPRIVRVKNISDRLAYEWFSGMAVPGCGARR